jgi:hypothetical protein
LAFSYWIDKPRFLTEGKLATVLIIPSSWGSQLVGDLYINTVRIKLFSCAVAREEEDFCKGSFARTSFTLFIVLLCFIFARIVLSKIQKKIVSFIVAFIYLLLVLLE